MGNKPKNNESTSARVATIASELLRNPRTPAKVKTVAASVLTQTPNKTTSKSSGGKKR